MDDPAFCLTLECDAFASWITLSNNFVPSRSDAAAASGILMQIGEYQGTSVRLSSVSVKYADGDCEEAKLDPDHFDWIDVHTVGRDRPVRSGTAWSWLWPSHRRVEEKYRGKKIHAGGEKVTHLLTFWASHWHLESRIDPHQRSYHESSPFLKFHTEEAMDFGIYKEGDLVGDRRKVASLVLGHETEVHPTPEHGTKQDPPWPNP